MSKNFDLESHLEKEHKQSPLSEYLKEIIYGGNDGIVTTFAVVAGFSGASITGNDIVTLSFATVMLFGLANLFADAASMGLGNFLAVRAEKDVYNSNKKKEEYEVRNNPDMEALESKEILLRKGFTENDANTLISIYRKNPEYWTDWMMKHELEMQDPEGINPIFTAGATFISFVIFGSIPLIPFAILNGDTRYVFLWSLVATFLALALLGVLKWKIIGGKFFSSIFEILTVGGISATIAFFVGVVFRG